MTDNQPANQARVSRRSMLIGGGASLGAVPLLAACAPRVQSEAAVPSSTPAFVGTAPSEARLPWVHNARQHQGQRPQGAHLITLGISGGPGWYPTAEHAGIEAPWVSFRGQDATGAES